MLTLVAGLVLFLGVHSVRIIAPGWRNARLEAMGEGGWKGIYTILSLIGFALIVWGYSMARYETGILYTPPMWLRHVALLLMAFAFISLTVYMLKPGRLKPMLKHPLLLATKVWAFAHLLANGETASVLLFGSFLAWAVLDRISLKRRGGALPQPGPVVNDIIAVVSGLLLWAAFVWYLHEFLFGVSPIA